MKRPDICEDMMRTLIALFAVASSFTFATAQSYWNIDSYCAAMIEFSTPTLVAQVEGKPKQEMIEMMEGMTDPKSIRMVLELIEFASSRPREMKVSAMRAELRELCIERKIFVQ